MLHETCYARNGNVNIAYQVIGSGPLDLVIVPGFVSHLEAAWDDPSFTRFLHRLASFSRLIVFDKRGTGLSDRIAEAVTLEERMDDVRAVMDAVGSKQAVLFGISEGGPMSMLFAATYPERTTALILYGTIAKGGWASDYPWGPTAEGNEGWFEEVRRDWGGPFGIDYWAPSHASDERFKQWWAKYLRMGASPGAVIALFRLNFEIDVRQVLLTITTPTLVLHRAGDQAVNVEQGRYIAERIPGAKYVELPGNDHLWWVGDSDSIVNEIEEFLTGARPVTEPDRVLATILFTDIVESSKRASAVGDRQWRDLLASHHSLIRREIDRFRGRAIKNTGDGFLATFDGPARAIRCAHTLCTEVSQMGLEIRAGLHTGEIELMGEDIGGIAVHIAARVMAQTRANQVWASRTVKDLVAGSGFQFRDQGLFTLKGIEGEWRLFVVEQ
jgi:class 3 adenylate cyclase